MGELLNFAGKLTIVYFVTFLIFYLIDKRQIFNNMLLIFGLAFLIGWFVIPGAVLYLYPIYAFIWYLISNWLFELNRSRLNQFFY